jgi:ribonuclease BN (tRNA processing enzyme)
VLAAAVPLYQPSVDVLLRSPLLAFSAPSDIYILGQRISIDGRTFTPLPANHTVPAVGYQIESAQNALVFTGDTYVNDPLWKIVNRVPNLKYLIIETAFCNRELQLAVASKHLCPSLLAEELAKLERTAEIFITHLKPGEIELTMQEIEEFAGDYKPRMLQNGQVFEF